MSAPGPTKSITLTAVSETATITIAKSLRPAKSRDSRCSDGCSWTQGGHQVAQKWTRDTGASCGPSLMGRPRASSRKPPGSLNVPPPRGQKSAASAQTTRAATASLACRPRGWGGEATLSGAAPEDGEEFMDRLPMLSKIQGQLLTRITSFP